MTDDNAPYPWRYIPLAKILQGSRLVDDLHNAGYYCAGDVLDATEEQLVQDIKGIGIKRAAIVRQRVLDFIKPAPGTVVELPLPAPVQSFSEAVLGCLALLVIGAVLWAAWVMTP